MRIETRSTLTKLRPTYWETTDDEAYLFKCECGQKTVFAMPENKSEHQFECMGCDKSLKLINMDRMQNESTT
ncbi:MAG TPA: hypothetical protein PK473_03200 [Nitrosomonas sp.]|nr:hypothetical protein [Nitrosomonas sp.]